jgi:hypothetical protein
VPRLGFAALEDRVEGHLSLVLGKLFRTIEQTKPAVTMPPETATVGNSARPPMKKIQDKASGYFFMVTSS